MAHVEVEELLAELAEQHLLCLLLLLFWSDDNEVFDAGDSCPAAKIEHIGLQLVVPLWRFVLEAQHALLLLLPLLLEHLVQPLRIGFLPRGRNVGSHLPRSSQSEKVGLVLYGDGMFCSGVDRVVFSTSVRLFIEQAVELSAEEVGSETCDDTFLGGVEVGLGGVGLGNHQVAVLVLDDSNEVAQREVVVQVILEDRFATVSFHYALEHSALWHGKTVVGVF